MKKYNYLISSEQNVFFDNTRVEPLTINDGIPIPSRYFDKSSLQTKVPSYVWKTQTNEIVAFVVNDASSFKDIGYGIRIVGYQSVSRNISFLTDILPCTVKRIRIVNKENGYPYDYIIFMDEEISKSNLFREKVESLGFMYDEKAKGFLIYINERNAPE